MKTFEISNKIFTNKEVYCLTEITPYFEYSFKQRKRNFWEKYGWRGYNYDPFIDPLNYTKENIPLFYFFDIKLINGNCISVSKQTLSDLEVLRNKFINLLGFEINPEIIKL